ncbi:hypothetical protein VNI00_011138 [Paramarasmius palmivorus]|uniref:Uncharacterized protein n=1 Tax=Paramarasmius palmivorus TaxID=297713 RepID=A0AAW0CHL4_9AGAR
MAKTSDTPIDPDTGKPYRMCRKCGASSAPHPMKHCTSYRRRVKGAGQIPDITACIQEDGDLDGSRTPRADSDNTLPGINGNSTSPPSSPRPETLRGSSPDNQSTQSSSSSGSEGIPDSLIDPALRAASNDSAHSSDPVVNQTADSSPATPTSSRITSDSQLRLMDTQDQLSLTPSSSTFSSPLSTPSRTRRKRPTKADPCFGEVIGAYRGNRVLTIRRTRQPTEEKLKARRIKNGRTEDSDLGINIPKVFYDRTRSLIHDLAEITGSWVHFSAQHPTASQPFIHYTSKRLRSEGGDLLDNLHQANHELYQSLMTARRCDTTQLAAQLARTSDKLVQVEADAEAKVADATAAKEAAEKVVSDLRAVIVAAGLPLPSNQ